MYRKKIRPAPFSFPVNNLEIDVANGFQDQSLESICSEEWHVRNSQNDSLNFLKPHLLSSDILVHWQPYVLRTKPYRMLSTEQLIRNSLETWMIQNEKLEQITSIKFEQVLMTADSNNEGFSPSETNERDDNNLAAHGKDSSTDHKSDASDNDEKESLLLKTNTVDNVKKTDFIERNINREDNSSNRGIVSIGRKLDRIDAFDMSKSTETGDVNFPSSTNLSQAWIQDLNNGSENDYTSTTGSDFLKVNNEIIFKRQHRSKSLPPKSVTFPLERKLSENNNGKRTSFDDVACTSGICLVCNKWVGVHHTVHSTFPRRAHSGDIPHPSDSTAPCMKSAPASPLVPHIVVSQDTGDEIDQNAFDFERPCEVNQDFSVAELPISQNKQLSSSAMKWQSSIDVRSSRNDVRIEDEAQRSRHNSFSSYLTPDVELSVLQRKTRRSNILGMLQHASSFNNLTLSSTQKQQLAFAACGGLHHGVSKTSLAPSNADWRSEGNDSMVSCLSALYGKILVVMGLAFPIGEFISGEMPLYVYKGYYLYLHLGSIAFLIYSYMFLLQVVQLPKVELKNKLQNFKTSTTDLRQRISTFGLNFLQKLDSDKPRTATPRPDMEKGVTTEDSRSMTTITFQTNKNYTITESTHESMYLKMGATLFGIGSMIYSGLEVGQYFDLKSTAECADLLLVISPLSRMLFTFIQMYFIFLNSRVAINKHRTIARFGLMHMIATNLCIWLNVLVEETKHEIHSLTSESHHANDPHSKLLEAGLGAVAHVAASAANNVTKVLTGHDDDDDDYVFGHHVERRATDYSEHHEHPMSMYDCRKSDMMSNLVDNASPFLFPCTIEYSLLCSGVLYVIWKNINKSESSCGGTSGDSDISTFIARKARHHYSVDCAHATRGLFMGILVLVLTIISLILFFVLINNEKTKSIAVLEANIMELCVHSVAIVTVVIGMIQMRELEFVEHGDIELDNILLLIAQTGTYIYTCFNIIGGDLKSERLLPFFTAVITLVQTTLQTLFILNASRRCCYTYDQLTRKPGREMVTFLLICNLAMWAISTFETSRADSHPTLLNYYGAWAWTIISHFSMPLAIFYRFHVTVCLCEIWKRSYKLKNDFI